MIKFSIFLLVITLAGLFYVYEEVEAVKIGYIIRNQEELKCELLDRARTLEYNIANLKSPNNLTKKLALERIQLESPKSWEKLIFMDGGQVRQVSAISSSMHQANFFSRFFMGTAQAEANDLSTSS